MKPPSRVQEERALNYVFNWGVLASPATVVEVLTGLKLTILLSVLAMIFGSLIGMTVAVLRLWGPTPFRQLAYGYVDLFRATPPLVQLIWIYYVGPMLLGFDMSAVVAGTIALSLNSGAFLSEVFRAGLKSIERGQRDAADVLGLSRRQAFFYVIVPQAIRRVGPAVTNIFMSLIKDSALLSVIGVAELTFNLQSEVNQTFRPFELYTLLAVIYLLLTYPLSIATTVLERRFKEH
jgi:His/Glu/Gln/Arg/opine family amino acid ABC transporter permease subunit